MENSNLLAFYRQLTTRIVVVFLLAVISISFALFLFWQSEQGNKKLITTTLPFWQQQIDFQQTSSSAKEIIEKISSSNNASHYLQEHQNLKALFQRLINLAPAKNNRYKGLLNQQIKLENVISRLIAHSDVNQQLKADALIQLQLMLITLNELTDQKQQQQQQLFKQIVSDNVTDRVTANRAKAYARITNQLLNYTQLRQFITELSIKIKSLSITSSDGLLESIASSSEHLFLVYDELLPNNDESGEVEKLQVQLINFEQLLLKKQNFLAKWRGQLRLSKQHHQQLLLWLKSLQSAGVMFENTVEKMRKNKKNDSVENPAITAFIQRYYSAFTQQYFVWLVFALIAAGVLLILILLINLRRKIKYMNQHTVTLAQQIAAGEVSSEQLQSQTLCAEEQKILTAIEQLQQPEYSKQDYLNLQQSTIFQNQFLNEHNHCCFWQLPTSVNEQKRLWHKILASGEQPPLSWRRYFSKQMCLSLIEHAKIAKQRNSIQQLELTTLQDQTVEITFGYQNKQWFGSLINVSTQAALEYELANLAIKLDQQYHQIIRYEDEQQADLNKLLAQVMLQAQSISIDSDITVAYLYRLLNRIKQHSKQKWLANEFILQGENKTLITPVEHSLVLNDINFAHESFCATINANIEAHAQQNQIQLNFQHKILPLIKLDTGLFQQLFNMFSSLMLEQQFKTKLAISVRLHDKNSGQQSVALSFKLLLTEKLVKEQKNVLLVKQLKLLILEQHKFTEHTPNKILALHTLLSRLLVSHVEVFENDEHISIELIMPQALSTEHQTAEKVHFNQQHFLVISTDEYIKKQVDEMLKASHAFNHHLAKAEYFTKQYSLKQLTKQPIAAVILASDSYVMAVDIVSNHIASLPNKLKPKLFVMQSLNQYIFEQHGFYAFTDNLVTQQVFVEHVQRLLESDQVSNQLLTADYCQQYRYQSTQVEVLVAVENILKQQHVIRLLTWLGMQVTVVSNSYAMLQHWQTGRYLVLITEFEQSPLVELVTGKIVARGIFSITKQHFALPEELPELANNWQIDVISNVLDLVQLTDILKPWLKTTAQSSSVKNISNKSAEIAKVKITHKKTLNNNVEEQTIATDALNVDNLVVTNQAFDLQNFARNQGSAELAAFMIDEYLLLIADHLTSLKTLIENKEIKLTKEDNLAAKDILQRLRLIAKIMSAADFDESCLAIEQSLTSQKLSKIKLLMQELEQQAQLLTRFAEAI